MWVQPLLWILSPSPAGLCLQSGLLVLQLSAFINSKSKYRQMLAVPRMLRKASHTRLERTIFWN